MDNSIAGKSISQLPICGIYAISLFLNIPLVNVFNDYKKMFDKRDNWKGRTLHSNRKALLQNAYKCELVEITTNLALAEFCKAYLLNSHEQKYLITISGHVLIYSKGLLFDQTHSEGIAFLEYRRATGKIKNVIIERKI